jgi:hypothetical protein
VHSRDYTAVEKRKCCCRNRSIFATKKSIFSPLRGKSGFDTRISLNVNASGTPAEHKVFLFIGSGRIMGCLMKSAIANHVLPDEYFVLQIDGQTKSGHRRFVDALRAALQLREQFPQHDIKVRSADVK